MDRRRWVVGSLSLLAGPLVTAAQSRVQVARIGILTATKPEASNVWEGFFQGLRDLGYVEGQNVVIEVRHFGDTIDRLPALAAELVRLPVDVIVTGAAPEPEAAKSAASTIPIVTAVHLDPVGSGLVASLGRPGGNVTGLTIVAPEIRGKQLQLLKEDAAPRQHGGPFGSDLSIPRAVVDTAGGCGAVPERATSPRGGARSGRTHRRSLGRDAEAGRRSPRPRGRAVYAPSGADRGVGRQEPAAGDGSSQGVRGGRRPHDVWGQSPR